MVYSFDSLGYARRLRERGVAQDHAEAHAEAARDFIMAELATKTDLLATEQRLQTEFRSTIAELRSELRISVAELHSKIDTQGLRLTVRLGALVVVALGALATIMKLAQ
jgi:hypothetical protein